MSSKIEKEAEIFTFFDLPNDLDDSEEIYNVELDFSNVLLHNSSNFVT